MQKRIDLSIMLNNNINLPAILIADLMGAVLTMIVFFGNIWRLRVKTTENRCLMYLVVFSFISCVADYVSFQCDGQPGTWNRVLVYVSNSWLYAMNVCTGLVWVVFIMEHLHIRKKWFSMKWVVPVAHLSLIPLIINLFIPLVFSVDGSNTYKRAFFFYIYLGIDTLSMLVSVFLYIRARRMGGVLKVFPIWVFVVPVFSGLAVQTVFYGISAVWPFIAISVAGVFTCLQNELVFRDTLTGLYNRFYMDYLRNRIGGKEQGNTRFTAMMLDMDRFKDINDRYGHLAGDQALISAAKVLSNAVAGNGTVIRYAGDEFVVLLNTLDPDEIEACENRVRTGLSECRLDSAPGLILSASIGKCELDLKEQSVNEFLNELDRRMYESKRVSGYKENE